MGIDLDDQVQVAGRSAVDAGIAFARQPNSLAIAGAGFDANLNRFGAAHCSFAIAGGTFVLELARAATPRARDLELHPSTHLGDLSRALTFRTGSAAAAGFSFAGGAGLLPYYLDTRHTAADRGPEIHRDLVFEVRSRLGATLFLSLRKCAGENIPEAAPA